VAASPRYRLYPSANADMDALVDYLRERNPVAAVRFVEAAQATFEHVCEAPRGYPEFRSADRTLQGLRWRPLSGAFHRYLIFYRISSDEIVDVVRVLHSARDLERVLVGG
jgi:toxin ParE1/3/4